MLKIALFSSSQSFSSKMDRGLLDTSTLLSKMLD